MDEEIAKALAKDLKSNGARWERKRATPTLANSIPAKSGLYMFVYRAHLEFDLETGEAFKPTWILYVGRAGNNTSTQTLRDRYQKEYCKYIGGDLNQLWDENVARGRSEVLRRYLTIWPLDYWYLVIEDRSSIVHLEDRLIKLFAPPLNRHGRLKLKTGPAAPAFKVP